jgi:hypothetical protein
LHGQRLIDSCRLLSIGLAVVFATVASRARAGGPLGAQGSRLETSAYGIDLFQGPVLGTSRITGLAGAFTAIGEGADAIQWNPAAVSLRAPNSTTRDDYDLTGGVTLPSSVKRTDFDNNGSVGFTYDNFVWLTAGGFVQHDRLGLGVLASFQNYELGVPGDEAILPDTGEVIRTVIVRLLRLDPVVGYGFLDEQLHVGLGLRVAAFYGVGSTGLANDETSDERLLLNSNTIGAQAGVLFTPRQLPFRLGVALRSPVAPMGGDPGRIAPDAEGDRAIGDFYLPGRLELPWELEAGIAVQL